MMHPYLQEILADFSTRIAKLENTPKAETIVYEWQYLTDAEIKEIVGSNGDGIGGYTRELFDKIEAKIKEKNDISSS